ncbi:uncharacterized protein isoform X2 [Rhodnius prolixus]|uniref:uncharacterized protein isoform X2 n=1 Tax=Rhodnius prolixus TaxID=13249 RepID=UPI003D18EBB9
MCLIHTVVTCSQRFFLNVFFYTICTFLVVNVDQEILLVSSRISRPNSEHTSGLCENNSLSCDHQARFPNIRNNSCQMIFHNKTSSVCSTENLNGDVDPYEYYGKMVLKTYLFIHGGLKYTAFNVTFMEMRWQKIYMRFIKNQEKTPSICREFQVSEQIASALILHFDCLWNLKLDNQPYHFDYQAVTSSGDSYIYRYLFFAPSSERIDETERNVTKWSVFVVMDISAAPKLLTLRLQPAPAGLRITSYMVKVLRTLEDNSWVTNQTILKVKENNTEDILIYRYDTKLKFGKYKFMVYPQHIDCKEDMCAVSSPEYLIEMTEPKLLTGLVATVILIPILLMLYFIWKRNCDTSEPNREPSGPPKLLLMYKPVSVEHINTMMELYRYFKKCHLHPMIDQFGIADSETKDPVRWYIDAFNEADFVGIFASPIVSEADRLQAQKYNKYSHTEIIAQNQLSRSLCSPGAKCKFFCVSLPGTQWDTLPPEAQALKRYKLPLDLDPLLVLIGVAPQCDRGVGFEQAIETARACETNFVFDKLPEPPFRNTTSPIPDEEIGPSTASGIKDDDTSLCLDTAISGSDLLSSRQYLSDEMSTPPSSLDQLSLLATQAESRTKIQK